MGRNLRKRPKLHSCPICPIGFRSSLELSNHARAHTGERPFKCVYCDKTYTRKDHVMRHQRATHTGAGNHGLQMKVKGQSQCQSRDDQKSQVERTMRTRRSKCNQDKVVKTNGDGIRTLVHLQVRSVRKCREGKKTSIKTRIAQEDQPKLSVISSPRKSKRKSRPVNPQPPAVLNVPKKKVTKGRGVPCKYCGKYFPAMSNLVSHERVHTGERPFPCRYCPRKFALDGKK